MFLFRLMSFVLLLWPQALLAAEVRKAPDVPVQRDQEKTTLLSLIKTNRVALIYFGDDSAKSWKALSALDALYNEFQYRGSNLEFLPYVVGKGPQDLPNLAEEHWLTVPLLADPDKGIARAFRADPLPRVALVDPFGDIRFEGAPPAEDELRKLINARVDKPMVKAFCPVDKMWVVVTDKTPSVVYKGERFYFCTPEDHGGRRMDREFLQDPDGYAKEAKAHLAEEAAKKKVSSDDSRSPMYQCPMKDSPAQNKPGRCPKCGMPLKKVGDEEHNDDHGDAHKHGHKGHAH